MKSSIVIGLQFGDESKGSVTSYLCSLSQNPLVIRFNGGHQAGHTVHYKGHVHKFSSFGSGTLQGAPTYWSKYCTFYPVTVVNEYKALKEYKPVLFIDPLCPVTTPFDLSTGQEEEKINKHGSCGVGFGATLKRQENYYKLFAQDLFYPRIFLEKLNNIIKYYWGNFNNKWINDTREEFLRIVEEVKKIIILKKPNFFDYDHLIFEGAQGIMLDMDFGFFPHVTRSNTTSKNAIEILQEFYKENNFEDNFIKKNSIYYVTRAYLTRHGNGPLPNEDFQFYLTNKHTETNDYDVWQGDFRTAILDIDTLKYALQCDNYFSKGMQKNLVITCLDQVIKDKINYMYNEIPYEGELSYIINLLKFEGGIFTSENPDGTLIKYIKSYEV